MQGSLRLQGARVIGWYGDPRLSDVVRSPGLLLSSSCCCSSAPYKILIIQTDFQEGLHSAQLRASAKYVSAVGAPHCPEEEGETYLSLTPKGQRPGQRLGQRPETESRPETRGQIRP